MYYKELQVDGLLNTTQYDEGLVSPDANPVKCVAVLINVSAHEGNVIEGWIGTERILAVYDYVFDTQELGVAATPPISQSKMIRLPVEENIPAGQIFKIAIRSGGTASNIYGAYEYEQQAS